MKGIKANLFVICFLFSQLQITAQNLVPNPSFELFDTCPDLQGQVSFATNWHNATFGSSIDYYNNCSSSLNVPYTILGYQQDLNNGSAFIGLYGYSDYPGDENLREFVQCALIDTLALNKTYKISFFINLCNDCGFAIDKMGAYLSDTAVYSNDTSYLPFIPQIESNLFLSDTINWTQISGYYKAHGGEKYITIGNFRSDSLTGKVLLDSSIRISYYYVDDVSITDCTATGINKQTINSLLQLAPNPTSNYFSVKSQQNLLVENVSVYSLVGEKVMEQNASGYVNELSISVAALPKGIYIVSVKTNKGVGYKKFLKM